MTQVIEFMVPSGTGGRADKVLAEAFPETSRSLIKLSIETGKTFLKNGCKLEPKSKLFPGELLIVDLSRPPVRVLTPYERKLDVFYEDRDLIVLNKPPGMVVHPGDGTNEQTLVHALLHHCPDELCPVGAPDRPGIVHRLDKETSGVMVVAKKEFSYHGLVGQFSSREVIKIYTALVVGKMKHNAGSFTEAIARHPKNRVKMAVQSSGKKALTEWKVLKYFLDGISMIECNLKTGRTHQIRVHLSHAGHPLIGDSTYGYNPNKYQFNEAPRVMLHARHLRFRHPVSGNQMEFSSELPEDMQSFIDDLA